MKLRNKITHGVILEQHKEPALSRNIIQFLNNTAPEKDIQRLSPERIEQVSADKIIAIAQEAGIIDERDGRPLYKKLYKAARRQVQMLVVDAMDDQPYISSQLGPLLGFKDEVEMGLKLALKATGAEQGQIAVYKNLSDLEIKIPNNIKGIKVTRIGGKYPAELRLSKQLRVDVPYAIVGVCSLIHLYRAVYRGESQTTCFVTVAGNCVGYPTNLEVSLGMTLAQVLERCGLIANPTRVVVGGPMNGIAVMDTDMTLVSPTTRGVLAFREDEREQRYSCIGCGRCIAVCPRMLNPMHIYRCLQRGRYTMADLFEPERCIGCGTCSYICPSKLPVAVTIHTYARKKATEVTEIETDTP